MRKWTLPVVWFMQGEVTVEAETFDEAIDKFKAACKTMSVPAGTMVEDSLDINEVELANNLPVQTFCFHRYDESDQLVETVEFDVLTDWLKNYLGDQDVQEFIDECTSDETSDMYAQAVLEEQILREIHC